MISTNSAYNIDSGITFIIQWSRREWKTRSASFRIILLEDGI